MTMKDAQALLFSMDTNTLERMRPAGVTLEDVIKMAISGLTANELADLGNVYGLKRQWYMYGGESDTEFGKRMGDYILSQVPFQILSSGDSVIANYGDGPIVEKEIKVPCWSHKWKHYEGIMDSFDFCEVCDEKRRKW